MKRSTLLTLGGLGLASWAVARSLRSDISFAGKVVIITGGSRGLGLIMARLLTLEGARLAILARDETELANACSELRSLGGEALPVQCDLLDRDQTLGAVQKVVDHFGTIDVLINNAGIIEVGPVEDQPLSAYRRAMATNFFGALHTTQAALPHMLRIAYDRPASIVNIASIGGKVAVPHLLPYVASKFALVGFSQGLHAELRHKGIRVTTVCPGLMRTGSHVHVSFVGDQHKESRWFTLAATTPVIAASVRHAANRIYSAVAAGRAEITITPQAWLAARVAGAAPATTQFLASLANEFLLPESPVSNQLPLRFNLRTLDSHRLHRIREDQPDQTPIPFEETPAKSDVANDEDSSDKKASFTHWPSPSDQPLM